MGRPKAQNKCKHVFEQGSRKGKKCNARCVADYCKQHNTTQKEYQKKYYEENVKKPEDYVLNKKLKKIEAVTDIRNITIHTIDSQNEKLCDYIEKTWDILREGRGIRIFLGELTETDLLKPDVQQLFNDGEITKEELDQTTDAYQMGPDMYKTNDEKNWPENIRRKLNNRRTHYNVWSGDKKSVARKRLEILRIELPKAKQKVCDQKRILNALQKKRTELLVKREANKLEKERNEEAEDEEIESEKEEDEESEKEDDEPAIKKTTSNKVIEV